MGPIPRRLPARRLRVTVNRPRDRCEPIGTPEFDDSPTHSRPWGRRHLLNMVSPDNLRRRLRHLTCIVFGSDPSWARLGARPDGVSSKARPGGFGGRRTSGSTFGDGGLAPWMSVFCRRYEQIADPVAVVNGADVRDYLRRTLLRMPSAAILSASVIADRRRWRRQFGHRMFSRHPSGAMTLVRLVRERRIRELHGPPRFPLPPTGLSIVFAADVDGDGDMDVLSASDLTMTDRLVRERRQPSFTAHDESARTADGGHECGVCGGRGRRRRHGRAQRVCFLTTRSPGTRTTAAKALHGPRIQQLLRLRMGPTVVFACGRGRRRRHGRALGILHRRQDRLVRERRQRELHGPHDISTACPDGPMACLPRTWTVTATWTFSGIPHVR